MAVPTGDEASPLALQQSGLINDVLKDLVQRVPDVQGAVGVRRPVVEGEAGTCVFFAQALIEPLLSPERLDLGLAHL